jgi:type I restriction enzyme M protein
VVVPNGTLFGDGVCARIKEQLLTEFNLHTIVRLPNGVFAPYTSIPTNLLFFRRGGPTKEIWYYELPLPEGRKGYAKTKPLQFEEFASLIEWWPDDSRVENENAWRVLVEDVLKYGEAGGLHSVNLDVKNPAQPESLEHLPPEQLVDDILAKEREIIAILVDMKAELTEWEAV